MVAQALAAAGVSAFFADLRDHFYTDRRNHRHSTMPRDLSYDFLELGTMLERPDNVSRLLDVKYHYLLPRLEDIGGPPDLRQWAAVLRSASALEAFRKVYGNAIRVDRVVEILVFDPAFPRSMRFSIERVGQALGADFGCGKTNPHLNIRHARICWGCCTRAPRTRRSRTACTNF